jgi:hypothetical protein
MKSKFLNFFWLKFFYIGSILTLQLIFYDSLYKPFIVAKLGGEILKAWDKAQIWFLDLLYLRILIFRMGTQY